MYDVYKIRQDFPILGQAINGRPVTYLDTAASAQKPACVLEKMRLVYETAYANPHRGTYLYADEITREYEQARCVVQRFVNASSAKEIVFTRNATESINLVAATWGRQNLCADDEVLISQAEHHANLVTWQQICRQTGAKLVVFSVTDEGEFNLEDFQKKLHKKTKIVAVSAMSNVLGTIFPVKQIIDSAHAVGAKVLVDACQFAVHHRIDVQDWNCDFLAFSGHKTYGPTGIGVLYGRTDILQQMPPYQFGGDMIENVTYTDSIFADIPARFEAGTPASLQAIGLAAALEYMTDLGFENIAEHEKTLVTYMNACLNQISGLKMIGTAAHKGGVFSFSLKNIHPQDLAFVLNKENVYIRIGHHCAQPLVNRMGYESLARASLGLYSTTEDVDAFVNALCKAKKFFGEN